MGLMNGKLSDILFGQKTGQSKKLAICYHPVGVNAYYYLPVGSLNSITF
jgi:hypothetical protein